MTGEGRARRGVNATEHVVVVCLGRKELQSARWGGNRRCDRMNGSEKATLMAARQPSLKRWRVVRAESTACAAIHATTTRDITDGFRTVRTFGRRRRRRGRARTPRWWSSTGRATGSSGAASGRRRYVRMAPKSVMTSAFYTADAHSSERRDPPSFIWPRAPHAQRRIQRAVCKVLRYRAQSLCKRTELAAQPIIIGKDASQGSGAP